MNKQESKIYINSQDKFAQQQFNQTMLDLVCHIEKPHRRVAVVCIGSDRATGDCFGPLTGLFLSRYQPCYDFDCYGTIHHPVHANNLEETMAKIDLANTLVIAVDAALGIPEHVGHLAAGYDSIQPGKGVGKNLGSIGDICVMGIVNSINESPECSLQSTRLSTVYRLAEITSFALVHAFHWKGL